MEPKQNSSLMLDHRLKKYHMKMKKQVTKDCYQQTVDIKSQQKWKHFLEEIMVEAETKKKNNIF